MNINIKALTPELAADFFDFFDNRAFTDNAEWSCCYCTCFHMNLESEREIDEEVKAEGGTLRYSLRSRAERFIAEGTLCGYLAYANGVPIGFCNANDKTVYVNHINEVQSDNSGRIKAIACFVIAPEYRGKGIATALLERVVSDAWIADYAAIEVYPKLNENSDSENFSGPTKLYEKTGFVETAQLGDRTVMRKKL